jgi:hypothetical protein
VTFTLADGKDIFSSYLVDAFLIHCGNQRREMEFKNELKRRLIYRKCYQKSGLAAPDREFVGQINENDNRFVCYTWLYNTRQFRVSFNSQTA